MKIFCQVCGAELEVDYVGRENLCPNCGSYLHSCIQCEFYDPDAHNQCREPMAEYVPEKDIFNFCTFFSPKKTPPLAKKQKKIDPDEVLKKLLGDENK